LKIDENDFKGTISPIEAKNLIYINTFWLDRNLLHGLDISFKGHPVTTYRLREQINVDTTYESEDFVFERDCQQWKVTSERKNSWLQNSKSPPASPASASNDRMGQTRKLPVGLWRRKNSGIAVKVWQTAHST
jgi:hypothetical protein